MTDLETTPLLGPVDSHASTPKQTDANNGESFDDIPRSKRQLGLLSVISLIFNRIIGTGIYATPSIILRASGSVGMTFVMWLLGSLIAATGSAVYVELGTGLPRNGGEKNYLEFIYRRPRYLITCVYAVYALIMGSGAPNSVVFGEYVINALNLPPTRFYIRFMAILSLTFGLVLHGAFLRIGLRVQNALGMFKLVIILVIAISGLFSLSGVPYFAVRPEYNKPDNFEWNKFWEGSGGKGANAFVTGLYNVIWSFIGYSNANYALSEVRNPVKTIKQASAIAMISVTTLYILVNVAYFGVVSKDDILESRRIVAALFFRNLFGNATERVLSVFIALSTLGNNLAVLFSQGRIIQELGREGILPFSSFFSSNKPFDAPLAGIFTIYIMSCVFVVAPPPGDVYLFMLSLSSYSLAIINTLVSLGLLLLTVATFNRKLFDTPWDPPFKAARIVVVLFFLSNVFLVLIPFIPPNEESRTYERLPYWSHVFGSFLVSLIGVVYWYGWFRWIPRRKGYRLERESIVGEDGVERWVFRRVPIQP